MEAKKRVTLKELSAITGLSRTTIYNILNHKGSFSEQTRQTVLKAIKQYHYRPNLNARNLALRKKYTIAYVGLYSNLDQYYNQNIQTGLKQALLEFEDDGLCLINHVCCCDDSTNQQIETIQHLEQQGIEHFIIFPQNGNSMNHCVQNLIDHGKNVILLSNQLNVNGALAFIGCDYYQSGILCGQIANKITPYCGNIQIFLNHVSAEHLSTQNRFLGILDSLKNNAKELTICPPMYLNTTPEPSDEIIGQIIQQRHIDCTINIISKTTTICRQLQKSAKPVSMLTFDLYDELIPFIQNDIIDAVIEQNLTNQAYKAVKTMFEYLCYQKKPKNSAEYVPLNIIMKGNLQYFIE